MNCFSSLFEEIFFTSGCLKVGISGHCHLRGKVILKNALAKTFTDLLEIPQIEIIEFYSPLAEGADQLAASLIPAYSRIDLIVPLPMAKEEYLKTFKTLKGRQEFLSMLKNARRSFQLPEISPVNQAYLQLGNYLAEEVDLLIAVWNGEKAFGPGGTGDVVHETLALGKPVCWIYSDNCKRGARNPLKGKKQPGEIRILHSPADLK